MSKTELESLALMLGEFRKHWDAKYANSIANASSLGLAAKMEGHIASQKRQIEDVQSMVKSAIHSEKFTEPMTPYRTLSGL